MDSYRKLLLANKAFVQDMLNVDERFFINSAMDQKPDFLWIGCSDSRVPAEEVTGTKPGELFVHRNIANMVIHTDLNMLSVLQYAVEVLRVKHIIVCGHYGCGGVKNAMNNKDLGLINKWLRHIKDVYRDHAEELEALPDDNKRFERMVELNVIEQVKNVARTSIVQRSWMKTQAPYVHGWVYDIHTGYLREQSLIMPGSPMERIYTYDYATEE